MTIISRPYRYPEDFERIGKFLIDNYQPMNRDGNWFQPQWEYMHFHPLMDSSTFDKFRIWEDSGEIVGVVHLEWFPGAAFFQTHPDHHDLRSDMLEYAETNLIKRLDDGQGCIKAYIRDFDKEFESIAFEKGYRKNENKEDNWPLSYFKIPDPFPSIDLPDGYKLKSLEDENDLHKINSVLWRGFDHSGEPPEEEIEGRIKMQSGPHFRKDLTIIAQAPDGNYASFSGTWYDSANKIALVEPVATDPDHRLMGLGRAVVMEGIRRCGILGAEIAYVGSYQTFYERIGFKRLPPSNSWVKFIDKVD